MKEHLILAFRERDQLKHSPPFYPFTGGQETKITDRCFTDLAVPIENLTQNYFICDQNVENGTMLATSVNSRRNPT